MSEEGIIEIEVGLQARTKAEIDEYLAKTDSIKEVLQELRELEDKEGDTEQGLAGDLLKFENKKKKPEKADAIKALESFSESDVKKLQSFLRNPQGMAVGGIEQLLAKLGPNSAAILGIAGAVIASPIFFLELMKALSVKGGPFNRDFRLVIQEYIDVGLSRELVKMRELGDPNAQVILSGGRGWTPNNETWVYNSYYLVNETRIARIGLDDKAAGVRVS